MASSARSSNGLGPYEECCIADEIARRTHTPPSAQTGHKKALHADDQHHDHLHETIEKSRETAEGLYSHHHEHSAEACHAAKHAAKVLQDKVSEGGHDDLEAAARRAKEAADHIHETGHEHLKKAGGKGGSLVKELLGGLF